MQDIYIRNIVFGVLDSLVSTVGLLAGLSAGGAQTSIIIATGIIYAFVESFSMAVGSFISEESVELGTTNPTMGPIVGGLAMFLSSIFASLIPILPYALAVPYALLWSIGASLVALFVVGLSIRAVKPVSGRALARHVLKVMLLGGAAILLGVAIGSLFKVG
jgi:VIT1/CCC1 family predicted Fe2+/Mn2+ transporter